MKVGGQLFAQLELIGDVLSTCPPFYGPLHDRAEIRYENFFQVQ